MAKNPRLIDIAGQQYGRWSVLSKAGNTVNGAAVWRCLCACGTERAVIGQDLRMGKSVSCGCTAGEMVRAAITTHGATGTRLYRIWKAMRTRCTNARIPGFANYGGRGIRVCAEWGAFVAFREWALANGYADNLGIERKDTNGDYAPGNCTWATALEQNVNRRFVKRSPDGEAWSQIAKRNGIPVTLMHSRIHSGWPIEKAATLPKGSRLRS